VGDARTIARYPTLRYMLGGRDGGTPFPRAEGANAHLGALLRDVISEQDYRSAAVVGPSGEVLAQEVSDRSIGSQAAAAAGIAAIRRGAAIVDVQRSGDGTLGLLFAAPVSGSDKGRPFLGALVLDADPESFPFPLIRSEPLPTATGETMLARRESDEAVYPAPRRWAATRAGDRLSLHEPNFAMRAALDGSEQFGSFVDYRGVPVLAATRRLTTVPWGNGVQDRHRGQ
jgi:hypothetical protein